MEYLPDYSLRSGLGEPIPVESRTLSYAPAKLLILERISIQFLYMMNGKISLLQMLNDNMCLGVPNIIIILAGFLMGSMTNKVGLHLWERLGFLCSTVFLQCVLSQNLSMSDGLKVEFRVVSGASACHL